MKIDVFYMKLCYLVEILSCFFKFWWKDLRCFESMCKLFICLNGCILGNFGNWCFFFVIWILEKIG